MAEHEQRALSVATVLKELPVGDKFEVPTHPTLEIS